MAVLFWSWSSWKTVTQSSQRVSGACFVSCLTRIPNVAHSAAVYDVLSKLHKAGWMHNDIVDADSALRKLAWAPSGHAVLIDLVMVTRHDCHDRCEELEGARNILQLAEPRVIV
jgi:tRNA A-37 threonylcarbamoyl transferase component Bud32